MGVKCDHYKMKVPARTCAPKSGRARCMHAMLKTVATHPLQIGDKSCHSNCDKRSSDFGSFLITTVLEYPNQDIWDKSASVDILFWTLGNSFFH